MEYTPPDQERRANPGSIVPEMLDPNSDAYRARHDALTGLYNREGFDDQINELVDTQPGNFAVVAIDLNGMKEINDTLGHQTGDTYLKRTADTLRDVLRTKSDVLSYYRLGGDEFMVLCPGVDNEDVLDIVMSRIKRGFKEAQIDASVGAALHNEGTTGDELIAEADNQAKLAKDIHHLSNNSDEQLAISSEMLHSLEESGISLRSLIALRPILADIRKQAEDKGISFTAAKDTYLADLRAKLKF